MKNKKYGYILLGHVVTPYKEIKNGAVIIEDSKIVWVGPENDFLNEFNLKFYEKIEVNEGYIIPGLIDIHIHGAGGVETTDGTVEALTQMASTLVRFGVSSFVPTTVTSEKKRLIKIAQSINKIMNSEQKNQAQILGLHLEGPYIQPKKAGAQDPSNIRPIDLKEITDIWNESGGHLIQVSLAPELSGSKEAIKWLRKHGIVVSMGHTSATYQEALTAIHLGANQATHTYNCMTNFHHRKPGILAAVLSCEDVYCEAICDEIHVHPGAIRMLARAKGPDKVVLISDAISALGKPDGVYNLGKLKVYVKDGRATLKDGKIAGSIESLNKGLFNYWQWTGLPLYQAIRSATLVPAKIHSLSNKGRIAAGYDADISIISSNFSPLLTFIKGKIVWLNRKKYNKVTSEIY